MNDGACRAAPSSNAPYRQVIRARIVLYAAAGMESANIATRLDCTWSFVSRVRKRFFEERLNALEERPRSGRPARFPPSEIASVKAVACELPPQWELPFSRFSFEQIRRVVIEKGVVEAISATTLWEWLHEDGLRPWTHRPWIFPRDPEFLRKGSLVQDLYHRIWDGKSLGEAGFRDFGRREDEHSSTPTQASEHAACYQTARSV
jgi:transposase